MMGALDRMLWRIMNRGMLVPVLTREERERAAILSELQVLTNINSANSLLSQSMATLKGGESYAAHVEGAVPILSTEMTDRLFQIRLALTLLSEEIHDYLMKR